jgi:hypoxanthine phosphoribosyltransferase
MDLLYSASAIAGRVEDIATNLNKDFRGEPLVHVIVVMNGAFIFAADLARKLTLPLSLHFIGGSYFDGPIKHEVGIQANSLPSSFNSAPVILIEDILDSGKSVSKVRQLIADRQASQICLVSLLKRQSATEKADHAAFTIPDNMFVVGYGTDMDGRYRELPGIYHLASAPGDKTGVC